MVRFHQIELDQQLLPLLERAGALPDSLFDGLDAARAPRLDGGSLPIGALNFVKVHNADGLLCLVLNFLVAVRHKLDNDHTTACQELFNCDVLFHGFSVGIIYATGDATTFAVESSQRSVLRLAPSRTGQNGWSGQEMHDGLAASVVKLMTPPPGRR